MIGLITDEVVDAFAIRASPEALGEERIETCGRVTNRVRLQFGDNDYWADVFDDLRAACALDAWSSFIAVRS